MDEWLQKRLLDKYKEIENYYITYIVAPWGSGKTSSLKYYMKAYSKNLRVYIDYEKGSSFIKMQKVLKKDVEHDHIKYIIIDHIGSDFEDYILEFERYTKYKNNLRLILVSDHFLKPLLNRKWHQKTCYITYEYYKYEVEDISRWLQYNNMSIIDKDIDTLYHMSNGWKGALFPLLEYYKAFHRIQIQPVLHAIHELFLRYNLQEHMRLFIYLSLAEAFDLCYLNQLVDDELMIMNAKQMALSHCFMDEKRANFFCMSSSLKTYIQLYYPLSQVQVNHIHLYLATWFLNCQWIIFAIYHYHKCKHYSEVVELITTYSKYNYIDEYPLLISEVYTSIPVQLIVIEPFSYLKIISEMLTTIDPFEGYRMLNKFKLLLLRGEVVGDYDLIKSEVQIIEAFICFGDIDKMSDHFKKAHSLFRGRKSQVASEKLVITLGCPHILCIYYRKGYSLQHICKTLRDNFYLYLDIAHNNGLGMDTLAKAEYYMECGDLDQAKGLALKSKYISNLFHQDAIQIASVFLLARIAVFENDEVSENFYIQQLESYVAYQILMYEAHAALGYLYVISKRQDKIKQWQKTKYDMPYDPIQYKYISLGLSYMLDNEVIKVNACAQVMLRQYEDEGLLFPAIYANFLLCALQNDIISDIQYFYKLIKLCERDGIIMIFLEFQEYLYPYIVLLAQRKKLTTFEKRIVDISLQYQNRKKSIYNLSNKEREICDYLVDSLSARMISELLNISINTVNFHIKNIYRKLSVKNKAEMVKRYNEKIK